jgi:hypothetical protein
MTLARRSIRLRRRKSKNASKNATPFMYFGERVEAAG